MKTQRTRYSFFAVFLPLFLILLGCSSVTQTRAKSDGGALVSQGESRSAADTYRRLARQYEANQQPPRALFMWQVVEKLNPDDVVAKERIVQLKETIQKRGEAHFARGMDHLKKKYFQAARKEFLLALAYNPHKQEAVDYLRKLSSEGEFVEYEVREGDSPERIAQALYRDEGRHFIVTYFADTTKDRELRPGRILRLPAPEQETKAKVVNVPKPYLSGNEAPRVYDKAGAELRYSKGVAYYLAEQFPEAIKEWEDALRLDPEHPNARRNIQKARAMLRKARLK